MYEVNRSAVTLIPLEPFWSWLNTIPDADLENLSLEDLQEDSNTYLIKPCDDLDEAWDEIMSRLEEIFSAELADWCELPEYWPDLHPDIFMEWFDVRLSTVVTDLSPNDIDRSEFEPIIISPDA